MILDIYAHWDSKYDNQIILSIFMIRDPIDIYILS